MQLRPLHRHHLSPALDLVKAVGWNQTERDLQLFTAAAGNTYLAAEVDGKVAGTVAAIRYGAQLAWISMMIVAEQFRGQGISKRLLETIIEQLQGEGIRCIKLDATPAGRPVYRRLGFREECELHRLIHPGLPVITNKKQATSIREMREQDFSAILEMDQRIFGADRILLLQRLFEEPFSSVEEDVPTITGFLFGRQGRRFLQLGPLGAATDQQAVNLLQTAFSRLSGQALVVDVPVAKTLLLNWLIELGFQLQRPFYRMYLGDQLVTGQPSHYHLIAGPEFG